jgi:hypothetical protein
MKQTKQQPDVQMLKLTIGYKNFIMPVEAAQTVQRLMMTAITVDDRYVDGVGRIDMMVDRPDVSTCFAGNPVDTLSWTEDERKAYLDAIRAASALKAGVPDAQAWLTEHRSGGAS